MSRWFQSLVAFDQFLNALVFNGYADETMSANAYRRRRDGSSWGFLADVIDRLFFWQDQHCKLAYDAEIKRRQLPPEYRVTTTSMY